MTDRVEIQVRHFCTHPDAKQGQGCPMKNRDKTTWECINSDDDGDAFVCGYLEVEVAKETGK